MCCGRVTLLDLLIDRLVGWWVMRARRMGGDDGHPFCTVGFAIFALRSKRAFLPSREAGVCYGDGFRFCVFLSYLSVGRE